MPQCSRCGTLLFEGQGCPQCILNPPRPKPSNPDRGKTGGGCLVSLITFAILTLIIGFVSLNHF
jgi:hypothetical protein